MNLVWVDILLFFFIYYRKEKFGVGFFNDMYIDIVFLIGFFFVIIDLFFICDYVYGYGCGYYL